MLFETQGLVRRDINFFDWFKRKQLFACKFSGANTSFTLFHRKKEIWIERVGWSLPSITFSANSFISFLLPVDFLAISIHKSRKSSHLYTYTDMHAYTESSLHACMHTFKYIFICSLTFCTYAASFNYSSCVSFNICYESNDFPNLISGFWNPMKLQTYSQRVN